MAHYQHKAHDPKTGRFVKTLPQPQERPKDPQARPIELPADPDDLLTEDDIRRSELAAELDYSMSERIRLKRPRKPAPDWDRNPRDRSAPATGPGGDADGTGNLGF